MTTDIDKQELISFLNTTNPHAVGTFINPRDLIFEESVKMNCFYCGKYNNNWHCPPHLPDVNFKKMMDEYDRGLFVTMTYDLKDNSEYTSIRTESSVVLHKTLLTLEKWMWEHNRSTAISFIGGSCKLCKAGCGKDKCNNPYMARSPLEATGVNIIKSAHRYGIEIAFPTNKKLMRLGLLLWQDKE